MSPKSCESLLEGIVPLGYCDSDVDDTKTCPSERSVNTSAEGSSSEVAVCKEVSSQQSPLNMSNTSQCLSQVSFDHYHKLVELLDEKSVKEKDRIIKEVWGSNECFYNGSKFSKTKSLALLEALQID